MNARQNIIGAENDQKILATVFSFLSFFPPCWKWTQAVLLKVMGMLLSWDWWKTSSDWCAYRDSFMWICGCLIRCCASGKLFAKFCSRMQTPTLQHFSILRFHVTSYAWVWKCKARFQLTQNFAIEIFICLFFSPISERSDKSWAFATTRGVEQNSSAGDWVLKRDFPCQFFSDAAAK